MMAQTLEPQTATTDVVRFETSPPGLDGLHEFSIQPLDPDGLLFSMTARPHAGSDWADGDAPRLFLVQPGPYFADYSPRIPSETLAALGDDDGATTPEDLAILVVLNPGVSPAAATANLLAPVLLNTRTRRARQIVLDDGSWPLRAPLHA